MTKTSELRALAVIPGDGSALRIGHNLSVEKADKLREADPQHMKRLHQGGVRHLADTADACAECADLLKQINLEV
jgi:hypothetical protein